MNSIRLINKRLPSSATAVAAVNSTISSAKPSQNSFSPQTDASSMPAAFYPLPGNTTTVHHYQIAKLSEMNAEKQVDSLSDVKKENIVAKLEISSDVEIKVAEVKTASKKEFASLFPDRQGEILSNPLNVVSVAHQTKTDQRVWSADMEAEREMLTAQFINTASSIVESLHAQGYWADFIDPSSGRPYLGAFTNDALFETDPRLRRLAGTNIEDLGCCKVIAHPRWGTHTFVGTIFTNAPADVVKQVQ